MADKIERLEKAGVEYIAIASNTPHMVFDRIAERTLTPLISIVEMTCKVIRDKKMHKVGLLGTKSTVTTGFYRKTAERYGIEIVIPTTEQQDCIHSKYISGLLFNNIVPEIKEQLIRIVRELKEKESIEGLIPGGTQLTLRLK